MAASGGTFVSKEFGYDGGRSVTAYLPTRPAEAVVVAGDGAGIAAWGALLEGTDAPPTAVIGVHAATDDTQRLHEYSPSFDPARFEAHERFVLDDVRRWAATDLGLTLPAERSAVLGASASGELALALGLRHPELFGAIFSCSPGGGFRPPESLPARLPRTYLVAGTQEPFFLANARRWEVALRNAGAEVVMFERDGAHGDAFWQDELPAMVTWAFGRHDVR